jgi:hypothetical protein
MVGMTGCATFTNGAVQSIPVNSEPSGATVVVDGEQWPERTPCSIDLARRSDHTIVVTSPGYRRAEYQLVRQSSGAVRGNIWLGGLIGWIVDLCTGADNNLVPCEINAELRIAHRSPSAGHGEEIVTGIHQRTPD